MKGLAGILGDRLNAFGVKHGVEARSFLLPQQVQSGSYLTYLSKKHVPFQIVRDEETQKFGTLDNFNVLIIDDDRWK